jgi:hypothetical protein
LMLDSLPDAFCFADRTGGIFKYILALLLGHSWSIARSLLGTDVRCVLIWRFERGGCYVYSGPLGQFIFVARLGTNSGAWHVPVTGHPHPLLSVQTRIRGSHMYECGSVDIFPQGLFVSVFTYCSAITNTVLDFQRLRCAAQLTQLRPKYDTTVPTLSQRNGRPGEGCFAQYSISCS